MKILRSILLAIAGIMSIVFGVLTADHSNSYLSMFPQHETYANNAYTDIQNACADTVAYTGSTLLVVNGILEGVSFILYVAGVALLGAAVPVDYKKKQKNDA